MQYKKGTRATAVNDVKKSSHNPVNEHRLNLHPDDRFEFSIISHVLSIKDSANVNWKTL